ncbi:DeoR/GlpR family DNA-binding transcription regulator [Diplocloster hominis]|uniref:DeoR/GlpR family DNA-binding transcription regulator n=1 Tax=Diplocloster hominis TaxID=3079010 RepID=UPI0031BA2D28
MLAQERKDRIIEIISKNKVAKVSELSHLLKATEATIRRDLDELQENKKIRRIHGGAILYKPAGKDMSDQELSVLCPEEKKLIAQKAYEFIDDNDAVIIDSSTTCLELIRLIASGNKKGLSVITNSFKAIFLLIDRQDIQLIHTGGQVKSRLQCAYGTIAVKMVDGIKVDKCFIGTSGIDPEYGYSDPNLDDCAIKEHMLNASKQKFVLADHTKFNESYIGKFADFCGTIDYLITDSLGGGIDREVLEANVNLILAS